jgi:hypothetical protein
MKQNPNGIPGQIRHGDVLIERVGDVPAAITPDKKPPVLAEGEISGHSHTVFGMAVMFRDDGLARSLGEQAYIGTLDAAENAKVSHVNRDGSLTGEHDTLPIADGRNNVIAQREYDPEGERRAAD